MLNNSGRIELIMGPMFAGKTTELMRRVKREIHARRSCFVIKYAKDVRYDKDGVASHDFMTLKAQAAVSQLNDVRDQWRTFDVVAVDEGQFFPDLVPFCNTAADAGKIVMVSALDGDYLRKPFGQICELVPYCESVEKLTAVCMMCHSRQASFTRRTINSDEQELIGGAEMYVATCRQCYNDTKQPSLAAMRNVQRAIREVEESCLGIAKNKVKCATDASEAATGSGGAKTGKTTTTADSPISPAVRLLGEEGENGEEAVGTRVAAARTRAREFAAIPMDLDAPAASSEADEEGTAKRARVAA